MVVLFPCLSISPNHLEASPLAAAGTCPPHPHPQEDLNPAAGRLLHRLPPPPAGGPTHPAWLGPCSMPPCQGLFHVDWQPLGPEVPLDGRTQSGGGTQRECLGRSFRRQTARSAMLLSSLLLSDKL